MASLPSPADLLAALDLHARLARAHLEGVAAHPVRPSVPPAAILARVPMRPAAEGLPLPALADRLEALLALTPVTTSRRFFNQLFGGADPAAVLGDMLAPLLNTSMYTYKVAGPHVLMENALVEHMAAIAGLSGGEGVFAPGGSLSNQVAMVLARNELLSAEDVREQGLSGSGRLRVYTSELSHYSIRKAAGIIGIGRANVVDVATDAQHGMSPAALRAAIQADRAAGHRPLMINATAGTTVEGAFDPIDAIADVAAEEGLWLHVDGAWGGTLLLSPRTRHLLAGVERADSLTWDAHKMMGVPLTCSLLVTRRPGLLTRHLSEGAEYLLQGDSDRLNPATRSMQCGRRNDVLKLWAAWTHHGDQGYARRVEHLMDLTAHAVQTIADDPDMVLSFPPQSLNVCFEVRDRCSSAICEALQAQGLAMVGTGIVSGRRTVRLVCVDPAMTTEDIDQFFAGVRQVAASLPPADNAAVGGH